MLHPSTLVLRGGSKQMLDESERSIHDAIMIVERLRKNPRVIGGGGSIEMELSRFLYEYARKITGKEQILFEAFARALEDIPLQLAINAGFDANELVNNLRKAHAINPVENMWLGVNIENEGMGNMMELCVLEPLVMKTNVLSTASEAACIIMSVDETIQNRSSEDENKIPTFN